MQADIVLSVMSRSFWLLGRSSTIETGLHNTVDSPAVEKMREE